MGLGLCLPVRQAGLSLGDLKSPRLWVMQWLCRHAACLGPILAGVSLVLPTLFTSAYQSVL